MFESLREIFSNKKREAIRKKIQGVPVSLENMFIPIRFRGIFSVLDAFEKEDEFILTLVENEEKIPEEVQILKDKGVNVVRNGYCNTVEVLAGSRFFSPMYIKFKRIRWRDTESKKEYYNDYDFHPVGMKVLHEFAEHLKKISRKKFVKLFRNWDNIRYLRKEDFPLI